MIFVDVPSLLGYNFLKKAIFCAFFGNIAKSFPSPAQRSESTQESDEMKAFHEVRNYATDLMVWHREFENISFVAHWHREIELLYIKKGSIRMQVTDHAFTAREGDLVVCDTGEIHYSNSYSKDSVLDFIIFDTGLISSHYQHHSFSKPFLTAEEMESSGLKKRLLALESLIDAELSGKETYYQDIIRAALQDFWFRLLRVMPSGAGGLMKNRRIAMLEDFQNLLSYMEEHAAENITLEMAAEKMHFSPSHFSKIFKQLTGTGFVRYLNTIRITLASELLARPDTTMVQVAFSCGFQNVRSFNRVFREITGCTPSEYLRIAGNESRNFTYYKSNADIMTEAEKDPVTITKN